MGIDVLRSIPNNSYYQKEDIIKKNNSQLFVISFYLMVDIEDQGKKYLKLVKSSAFSVLINFALI